MLKRVLRIATKVRDRLHRKVIQTIAKLMPSCRFGSIRNELYRVEALPRHQQFETHLDGKIIRGVDSDAYVAMHREIFGTNIYQFRASFPAPYILDCGANIGLSAIYFKKLYPAARVVAFEPDPDIFKVLDGNVRAFGLKDVTLVAKGVWSTNTVLRFVADPVYGLGGHIVPDGGSNQAFEVPVVRLRDYLGEPVDLLKLDVEGAECEILDDCSDMLRNVKNIFIEYHSFVGRSQCLGRLLATLSDAGFRVHMHCAGAHSARPFVRLDALNGMDMQLNIYGVRLG
jgi:FkbM family methyltransferase